MKHFLFSTRPREKKSMPIEVFVSEVQFTALSVQYFMYIIFWVFRLLKPTESQQNEALIAAISEILWNIAEKIKVVIALTGDTNLIPHSHIYFQDSITEKVLRFF